MLQHVSLHIGIIRVGIHIFDDCLEVSTINLDFIGVIWARPSQLLSV